jgi:hypothetical protein
MPAERCTRPPSGWECSRPAGHDGPCAARQLRRFRAALPSELDWPAGGAADRGPRHFLVGLLGGFALGLLTAASLGWWPL